VSFERVWTDDEAYHVRDKEFLRSLVGEEEAMAMESSCKTLVRK
jgi:hypothetical protein